LGKGGSKVKIAVVGRGNVGGGLADLWEQASHEVKRIGREGGDVSEAEAVVVAVPGGTIAEALSNVRGMEGKTVIDATNLVGVDPPEDFSSNAEFVKSRTNGPTAKSFNTIRSTLRSDWPSALDTQQPVVRRRGGAAGCRATKPRCRL
jgi:predicted dinucleotide-binding enzyme